MTESSSIHRYITNSSVSFKFHADVTRLTSVVFASFIQAAHYLKLVICFIFSWILLLSQQQVFDGLKKISQQKKPSVIVISDNDAVLSKGVNKRLMSRAFDFDVDSEADIYDKDFKLKLRGQPQDKNRYLKVIRTRRGGHFAFLKHDSVVNAAVIRLIESLQAKTTTTATPLKEMEVFRNKPF